jgi:hypothetical protein
VSSQDKTKSGAAKITVTRTVTLAITSPGFPWNQIYSKYGFILGYSLTCGGCIAGDTLYATDLNKPYVVANLTAPTTTIPLATTFLGNQNVPEPIKFWIVGSDGVLSNAVWLLYRGSQNVAVQSATTGEIYYYFSGDETANAQGCYASILMFKSDGTPDGSMPCVGDANSIAFDDATHYLIIVGSGGTSFYDMANPTIVNGLYIPINGITIGSASTQSFAVAVNGGTVCITQPEVSTGTCTKESPDTQNPQPPLVTIDGLNDPLAVALPDPQHAVFYCAGNQVLQWYVLDMTAGTATPSGVLALQEFTSTTAGFWNSYVATGGWFLIQVGSTLGVMGQVVNADGTVDQELALVDNTSQKQISGNYKLPGGTILVAPDPADNAFVIEYPQYPDNTSDAPITNFARLYVGTGNMVDLASTSTFTPSVGFLVLQNGEMLTGVLGQIDLEPNQ